MDFKKTPPTKELLARWTAAFGWENVLNRRGTTWRLLPPAAQARVKDEKAAIALMLEKPTVIKRPVVETGLAFGNPGFAALNPYMDSSRFASNSCGE